MATWTHKGSGIWEDGANWDTKTAPGPGETVDLSSPPSSKYVVSITADENVDTVNIENSLAELFISSEDTLTANTLNLDSGTLFLQGIINGASINADGGTFIADDGELDNSTWNGTLALNGAKSTSFDNTLAVQNLSFGVGSSLAITGYDAELDVKGDMTLGGPSLAAITLGGAGKSNYIKELNGGTLTLASAIVSDASNAHVFIEDDGDGGTIDNDAGITFGDPVLKPKGTGEIQTANFNNVGAITINDQMVDITSSGVFTGGKNVGGFTNEATGAILVNAGTLTVHDNGTVFNVGGSISLSNKSVLDFYHTATGAGTITLSGASLADIDNYTGNVAFGDGTDQLWLESLSAFKGQVQDLQIGDTIDFRNVAYGFGDYVTVATNGSTGVDTVTVHKAAGATAASFQLFSLDFANLYHAANFTLSQDSSLGLVVGLVHRDIRDYFDDGTTDVLAVNTAGKLADFSVTNGVLGAAKTIASTTGLTFAGVGDFNGDGTSDVLFDGAGNALQVWQMNAGARSGSAIAVGGPAMAAAWSIAGVGDFNGDGTSDVLWRNKTTGGIAIWTMANDKFVSTYTHASPGAGYVFRGVGDFNGDGVEDILFQSTSTHELVDWQMSKGKVQSTQTQSPTSSWIYEGVGDFKGNGASEALFMNAQHGLVALNLITGSSFALGVTIPTGGSVAAVGDYNGDGVSDVLVSTAATGALQVSLGSTSGHSGALTSAGGLAPSTWHFLA